MKFKIPQISFDTIFKTVLMFFFGYLLFLLNKISTQIDKNADVGRYQFKNTDASKIIDTKTGTFKDYHNGNEKISW